MPAHNPYTFYKVIKTLDNSNIPLENLIRRSLVEPGVADTPFIDNFLASLPCLLGWLAHHDRTRDVVNNWVKRQYIGTLTSQLRNLTKPDTGLHFNASTITAEQMQNCTIDGIATNIKARAPDLWEFIGELLEADPVIVRRREKDRAEREMARKKRGFRQRKPLEGSDDDDDERAILDIVGIDEDEPENVEEQVEIQRRSLLHIKRVTCISIMMQATNQRCNSLQVLVSIFLQSCNVSEQVRNFLGRLGLSVSATTINQAIKNLSKEAYREMEHLGSTFLASYAYNNLDVDLVHSTPTIETTTKDTLVHLTMAAMFPLHPLTTKADLNFADHIRQLKINPPIPSTITDILTSLPSQFNQLDEKKRSIQDRFNAWKFIADLVSYGPPQFAKFQDKVGEPEEIECIPLTKTKQVPLRASKTGPSTPAKNATVIEEFFRQSNIGEHTEGSLSNPANPGNNVLLMHGDLLTVQHINSLQDSRVDDESPGLRFKSLLLCHGWFHARMACADAIWWRHIEERDSEKGRTSLINYVTQIRPLEKHKIHTNPTFRQLHEIITHVGITLQLDAWRAEISRRHPEYLSLEDWAHTNPTWQAIVEIAHDLVKNFVGSSDLSSESRKTNNLRDKVFEMTKAYHKDFLLYEETNYSMNHGDIGRLNACFVEWVFYFMGCKKAKYATAILHHLENMYIHLPKPLA